MKTPALSLLLLLLITPLCWAWEEYEATAYCSCEKCCNVWAKKGVNKNGERIFASGKKLYFGGVATDKRLAFGTNIETRLAIEGVTAYKVEDRGGAINGQKIDFWFPSHQEALNFGRRKIWLRVLD